MSELEELPQVAIIDYRMGNLFSVKHACEVSGMKAIITSEIKDIEKSDAVILPGVGAFRSAMESLKRLDLIAPLKDMPGSKKPLLGICLGAQLMMDESAEFGHSKGIGIFQGEVVPFDSEPGGVRKYKVPHVGWNRISYFKKKYFYEENSKCQKNPWANTLLNGVTNGEFMYFVHSLYVKPQKNELILAVSDYGHIEFCSAWGYKNIFACQFHPERSGPRGLQIYRNLALTIKERSEYLLEN